MKGTSQNETEHEKDLIRVRIKSHIYAYRVDKHKSISGGKDAVPVSVTDELHTQFVTHSSLQTHRLRQNHKPAAENVISKNDFEKSLGYRS